MKYEEIFKVFVRAKEQELQDQNKWIDWLVEFAIKSDIQQKSEIRPWLAASKTKMEADKAGLESQKIAAEQKLTQEINRIDSIKL